MNKRSHLSILMILGILSFMTSCVDEIKEPLKDTDSSILPRITKVTAGYTETDSLNIISRYQSDPDIIMLNNITCDSTGKPMLLISRSEAENLGISNEIYQKYYDHVHTETQNQ